MINTNSIHTYNLWDVVSVVFFSICRSLGSTVFYLIMYGSCLGLLQTSVESSLIRETYWTKSWFFSRTIYRPTEIWKSFTYSLTYVFTFQLRYKIRYIQLFTKILVFMDLFLCKIWYSSYQSSLFCEFVSLVG